MLLYYAENHTGIAICSTRSPVFKLFSFLHPKNDIQAEVELNGKKHSVDEFHSKSDSIAPTSTQKGLYNG